MKQLTHFLRRISFTSKERRFTRSSKSLGCNGSACLSTWSGCTKRSFENLHDEHIKCTQNNSMPTLSSSERYSWELGGGAGGALVHPEALQVEHHRVRDEQLQLDRTLRFHERLVPRDRRAHHSAALVQ